MKRSPASRPATVLLCAWTWPTFTENAWWPLTTISTWARQRTAIGSVSAVTGGTRVMPSIIKIKCSSAQLIPTGTSAIRIVRPTMKAAGGFHIVNTLISTAAIIWGLRGSMGQETSGLLLPFLKWNLDGEVPARTHEGMLGAFRKSFELSLGYFLGINLVSTLKNSLGIETCSVMCKFASVEQSYA